jgi:arginine deiminase
LLADGQAMGCDLPAILDRRGKPMQTVACGDGDPIAAAREQWTDGANAFCLGPGRIVLYARNQATLRALNRVGFEIVTAEDFIRNAALWMQGRRRFVVAVSGFELSRGRGGPRCLTLPVRRSP